MLHTTRVVAASGAGLLAAIATPVLSRASTVTDPIRPVAQ
jgi:hypothetical protein